MKVITYERCMALVCVLVIAHLAYLSDAPAAMFCVASLSALALMYWLLSPAWYSMAEQSEEQEA